MNFSIESLVYYLCHLQLLSNIYWEQNYYFSNLMQLITLFVLLLNFLLAYNCFTMLCQFLLYKEVNQLYIYIYPLPLGPPSHPGIPFIQVITEHRAELPVLCSRLPLAIYFTYGSVYMSVLISQFIPPSPSPSVSTRLCICISIPAQQICSSVPFFQILHICVNI